MRLKRLIVGLLALLNAVLFSGCGEQGWVRVSPDGQFTTVARKPPDAPEDSSEIELAIYHLERRQTVPVFRFSLDDESPLAGWVYNCQWTPDSRAVCFEWMRRAADGAPPADGDSAEAADAQYERKVLLYEVATGRLQELPIEASAPRWSADGRYLMGFSDKDGICLYRTDTWTCTQRVPLPRKDYDEIIHWDWAHWVRTEPPLAVVLLGKKAQVGEGYYQRHGDLYLLRGGQLIPLTTTGDVQAFWVDPSGVVVRWARVQHLKFLAVFERPLQGGAPRQIALIPNETLEANADPDDTYYRFSPDGQRLAWDADDSLYVLDLKTAAVHTLLWRPLRSSQSGARYGLKIEKSILGFDWRDAETLLVQRGHRIEMHTVHTMER